MSAESPCLAFLRFFGRPFWFSAASEDGDAELGGELLLVLAELLLVVVLVRLFNGEHADEACEYGDIFSSDCWCCCCCWDELGGE